jgi:hypothetical protein
VCVRVRVCVCVSPTWYDDAQRETDDEVEGPRVVRVELEPELDGLRTVQEQETVTKTLCIHTHTHRCDTHMFIKGDPTHTQAHTEMCDTHRAHLRRRMCAHLKPN